MTLLQRSRFTRWILAAEFGSYLDFAPTPVFPTPG
jgi:hypothetical protein